MLPETSLDMIPDRYPKSTKKRKYTLFPFALFVLMDLAILNGQESPKKTIIIASNISGICNTSFLRCGGIMI